MDPTDPTPTQLLWIACALFTALALLAAWRDHARAKRRDIDKVGWVPWSLVLVLAMMLALVCGALGVLV
jgi:hypothetical protein